MVCNRRAIAAVLLGLFAFSTPAPAQSPDIHGVDFRNYTYTYGLGDDPEKITVRNGEYSREAEDDRLYFKIQDVIYGDVTGDGKDEAVVRTLLNSGGTGQFTDGIIYTMRGGKPVEIGSLGVGDRADGGIHDVYVRDGRIVVERYGQKNSGACCPEYIERDMFAMKGDKLEQVAKTQVRGYQTFDGNEGKAPNRVTFLKGTSAVTLSGSTNAGETYVLGARAGQTVELKLLSEDTTASATLKAKDGTTIGTVRPGASWSGKLPANGDYRLSIDSKAGQDSEVAYYWLDVAIP